MLASHYGICVVVEAREIVRFDIASGALYLFVSFHSFGLFVCLLACQSKSINYFSVQFDFRGPIKWRSPLHIVVRHSSALA